MDLKYIYEHNKALYEQQYKEHIFCKEFLKIQDIEGGLVLPNRPSKGYLFGKGGVLDKNYKYLPLSGIYSKAGRIDAQKEKYETYFGDGGLSSEISIQEMDEEVIYLGYIFNHWGHFLVDCSTRLWYLLENWDHKKRLCFSVYENSHYRMICNIKKFFEYLNVDVENQILFINKPTRFKKITIPEAGYISNSYYSKQYLNVFEKVAENIPIENYCYKKIYFTRRKLMKAKTSEFGEELFEKNYERNGYKIIAPERCSLEEQVNLIRSSEDIVCISGTIAHNMLFATDNQKITILNKTYIVNVVQRDINVIKKLNVTYIDSYISIFPVGLGQGPFCLIYNEKFKNYLKDNSLKQIYSEKYLHRKNSSNIKKYVKRFRQTEKQVGMFNNDRNATNYFALENLKEYYENYYSDVYPLKELEKIQGFVKNKIFMCKYLISKVINKLK